MAIGRSGHTGGAASTSSAADATAGRAGTDVALVCGDDTQAPKAAAYHAVPAGGRGKGVLVIDEDGPLTDFARDACDRLARAGFAALAPDLGRPSDRDARIEAGVRHLLDDDATEGPLVGSMGFGEGAGLALAEAARNPRIGCVVCCYGPSGSAAAVGRGVPALLIFGEDDARVTEGAARELERSVASAKLVALPDAGDRFMNARHADRFAAAAAAAAWDAAIAFLGSRL